MNATEGAKIRDFETNSQIAREQTNRVCGYLDVGDTQYACIVDTEGCAIYKREMYPAANREYAEYEGRKTFKESLGAIAMIAGYHYPRKAAEVDQLLRSHSKVDLTK